MQKAEEILPLILICLVIVFAPLAFGTVHPLSQAIYKSLIVSLLALLAFKIASKESVHIEKRALNYLLVAFIVYILLTQVPVPSFMLKTFAPLRWNILFGSFDSIGIKIPLFHSLSVDPMATSKILSLVIFYCAFYFAVQIFLKDRKKIKYLSWTIIGAGFTVAFIAVAQKFSEAKAIYWSAMQRPLFYGTFVNPNHCAAYLAASSAFVFAFFLKERQRTSRIIFGFAFTLTSIAVFYSLSRGGVLTYLITMAAFLFFTFKNRSHEPKELKSWFTSMIFVFLALAILLVWWGTYKFIGELGTLTGISPKTNLRIEIWKDSLKIFKDFFFFGAGLGTFEDVFSVYRTFYANVRIEFAENDYIQLLTETGISGFGIIISIIYITIRRVSHILSKKMADIPRTVLGSIFALLALALNSLISFNFYIPGVMTLAIVLLAFVFLPSPRYR